MYEREGSKSGERVGAGAHLSELWGTAALHLGEIRGLALDIETTLFGADPGVKKEPEAAPMPLINGLVNVQAKEVKEAIERMEVILGLLHSIRQRL